MSVQSKYNVPPLCGNDGGFTKISIIKRLPDILDTVIEHNRTSLSSQQLESLNTLREELSKGVISSLRLSDGDSNEEHTEWKQFEQIFNVESRTWLELPWFFVENYFYKLILDVMKYRVNLVDPFERQKSQSLEQALQSGAASSIANTVHDYLINDSVVNNDDFLVYLLAIDLWGNKADLSFSGGAASKDDEIREHRESEVRSDYIVANDSQIAIDRILDGSERSYNFILDNCGLEVVCDLFFAHCLLERFNAQRVTFYVKTEPVFVSDVMTKDLHFTIDQLINYTSDERIQSFGKLFKQNVEQGKWLIQEHRFFTNPLPFYEMPNDLYSMLESSGQYTVVKGDANYRRLFNDRLYQISEPFQHLIDYFPTDVLSLRTLKSDCLVGVDPGAVQSKSISEPDWRVNGKYGVISFANKRKSPI